MGELFSISEESDFSKTLKARCMSEKKKGVRSEKAPSQTLIVEKMEMHKIKGGLDTRVLG